MRLLKIDDRGELSLTHDLHKDLPPYAILSHTWGDEHEEVTLDDLKDGSGMRKAGYTKIQFCADQARKDGLQYIWVDTCSIDKKNQAELAEAIVSMFRWYTNAAKCYVFLSDVSSRKRDSTGNVHSWEPTFRGSRWFTRGWTLQELLAPGHVEFFSREGERLGDKGSLESIVHEITGIPIEALRGTPLKKFSADERMRWASERQTTRSEDRAYCLLGIFDVAMPPIYGEGDNAFVRLKDEIAKSYRRHLEAIGHDVESFKPPGADKHGSWTACTDTDEMALLDRRKKLMASLGFDQMDSRRSTIKNAYSTTCRWLLKHPAYIAWVDPEQLDQHRGFLWITGKPGAGKSTLVKFAHAHAGGKKPDDEILLSFFFNARGEDLERSTIGMYRALLFQLLDGEEHLQELLNDFACSSQYQVDEQAWTIGELCKLLCAAIQKLGRRRLKCFVDALDECNEQQVQDMITFFEDLGQVAVDNGVELHVCFASRHFPIIDIRNGRQLILENEDGHAQDLAKYVQSHFRPEKNKLIDEVRKQIQEKANGVFLWAVLVVNILNKEFKNGRIWAVKQRLKEIPPELSDLFKDILTRDCTEMDEFLLCLQWILFTKRPLRREEFYYAMISGRAPDSEEITAWDADRVTEDYMNRFVLASSKGFAELTKSKTPTVQFIHESVRDFLVKDRGLYGLWPDLGEDLHSLGHDQLKRCCLNYLKVDISGHVTPVPEFLKASSDEAKDRRNLLTAKFPFLDYASHYVLHHAEEAATGIPQTEFLADFALDTLIQVTNLFERFANRRYTPNANFLYILSENNCARLIRTICHSGPAMGVRGERYHYPLFVALVNGHREAVRALLNLEQDQNIPIPIEDTNVQDFRRAFSDKKVETPLSWALESGYNTVAEILVKSTDFYSHTRDAERSNTLFTAVKKGHEAIVDYLMAADGFKTRWGNEIFVNGLHHATMGGHTGIVRLLLDNGADIEANPSRGPYTYKRAIHIAAANGSESLVQLLLDKGVDLEATNRVGYTALMIAAVTGYASIVQLLLDKGANPNAISKSGRTALWCDSHEIAQLLLDNGADVKATDNAGWTALIYSIGFDERSSTTQLLLAKGADIEHTTNDGFTALMWGAQYGSNLNILLLLYNGANVEALNRGGKTALHYAAAANSFRTKTESTVKLLLEWGANIEATDNEGKTALHYAARGCFGASLHPTVQVLLERGADIEATDNTGRTALHYAAGCASRIISNSALQLLIEKGANIGAIDNGGKTALHYAVVGSFWVAGEPTVQLLLVMGADIEATDSDGLTALDWAVKAKNENIAMILRDFVRDRSLWRASMKIDYAAGNKTKAESVTTGYIFEDTGQAEDSGTAISSPGRCVQGIYADFERGESSAGFAVAENMYAAP